MRPRSSALLAVAAGVALLGATSCSSSEGGGTPVTESPRGGLGDVDPCSFFAPDDLAAAGVEGPGAPEDDIPSVPGCTFEGESVFLSLYKNQDQTVDSYETAGSWDEYQRTDVNGRAAARAIASGSAGNNICSTLLDAGGGVVQVKVTAVLPDEPVDTCAKANEMATRIEPRLPE